jgi:DNA-binding Xre family transcriptional regulator
MEKVKALMENKGMKKWDLRQRGINGTVLDKVLSGPLNKSKRVDTETINKLCHILECQPGDIMEYVEDGDAE